MNKIVIALLSIIALFGVTYVVIPNVTLFNYLVKAERSIAGLELEQVIVDDLHIEYLRGGKGDPLVLLHGFGADKDNWNRIARHLSGKFEIIALDIPGFGNSTKDIDLDYDVSSQVRRLNKITADLGLTNFNLAGSSMGGYIAGNFAAQYPDKVNKLWLISPFGVAKSQTSEMFAAVRNGESPVVLARTDAEFTKLFNFLFVEPPFVPAPVVNHLAAQASLSADLNSKIFEQIHRMENGQPHPDLPLDKVMKQYTGPVLITWGQNDRVLHVSGAQVLKQIIPQAQIDVMQNVGHLPMVEQPKISAESFVTFAQ